VGLVRHLSEIGLVDVFPLVDLVAVGTGVICVCLVLGCTSWFVLLQFRH